MKLHFLALLALCSTGLANKNAKPPKRTGERPPEGAIPFQIKNFDKLQDVDEDQWLINAQNDGINVLLNDPKTLVLTVLESEEKCGQPCAMIKKLIANVAVNFAGAYNFAVINGGDTIIDPFGEEVEAIKAFNLTTIPEIRIFPSGPKRFDGSLPLDSQTSIQMFATGAKPLFDFFKMFSASTVQTVKPASIETFFASKRNYLPRVLLVASKPEITATYKSLSTLFSSRAVFGQAVITDTNLISAFGLQDTAAPVLLVSKHGELPVPEMVDITPNDDDDNDDNDNDKKKSKNKKKNTAKTFGLAANSLVSSVYGWQKYTTTDGGFSFSELRKYLDGALPEVSVPQLRSHNDFIRHCANSSDISICFIGVLPAGADERNQFLSTDEGKLSRVTSYSTIYDLNEESKEIATLSALVKVANLPHLTVDWSTLPPGPGAQGVLRSDRLPCSFAWIDGESQSAFASVFKADIPSLIAVNPRKKAYASFRGTFDAKHINEFVFSMLNSGVPAGASLPKGVQGKDDQSVSSFYEQRRAQLIKMETLPSGVPELQTEPDKTEKKKKKKSSTNKKKKSDTNKKQTKKVKTDNDDDDKDEL